LLAEPLRHVQNPKFSAVIFRRTTPEIRKPGGLWDESSDLYPQLGGVGRETFLDWSFPSGATINLSGLENEADLAGWQGSQVPLIQFDELTTFSERMCWFMLSRNRSGSGVKPYIRASCNPDAESWVAKLIAWWIDQDTGFAIPERAGVVRWFYRVNGEVEWYDSAEAARRAQPRLAAKAEPKSFTFVPADVYDNKILLARNPEYLASLMALPHIEQERFLKGNWKITNAQGEWPPSYFGPSIWFEDWPKHQDTLCHVWMLDPSKGRRDKVGDYSAYIDLVLDRQGCYWFDADLQRRSPERIVEDGLEHFRRRPADGFGVESNAMQELFGVIFKRRAREQQLVLPLYLVDNYTVAKAVRIRRLGPLLAQGKLRAKANSPGAKLAVQQLKIFRGDDQDHDDGPDALEMGKRLIDFLLRRPGQAAAREVIRLG
jgi:hypothetical protein